MASTTHRNGHAASNGVYRNGRASSPGHAPAAVRESGPDPFDLLWDGLSPAVTRELEGNLDASLVSRRRGRGGRMYDYIEGHAAIAEANRIFGYGGWGYEVVGDVALREMETVDAETGELKTIRAYSAPVRVTVPGAPPRTDVGFRTVVDETGEGHETACKGAVTDGMKRALRSFGDRFGNGLYDPQGGVSSSPARGDASPSSRRNGSEDEARRLRSRLLDLGDEQGFDENAVRAAVLDRTGQDLDELPVSDLKSLVDAAYAKVRQMRAD